LWRVDPQHHLFHDERDPWLSEKEYEETLFVWAVKVGRKCRWPDL